jgi:hypothetical protein
MEEVILTSLFPKSPYISSPLRGQVVLNCLRTAWETYIDTVDAPRLRLCPLLAASGVCRYP